MITTETWQTLSLLEKLETIGPGLFRAVVPFIIAIGLALIAEGLIRKMYVRKH